ncbi:hypothetical protein ABPG72_007647 [Tetrahymena utriculariae]
MKKQQNRVDSAHFREGERNKSVDNNSEYSKAKYADQSIQQLQQNLDTKWSEIKIFNKNICRRSYHSAVSHEDRMYIYGGYEVNEGILGDFYEMMIKNNQVFQWQKVNLSKYGPNNDKPLNPGPLMRHTAVTYKDKMYIYGGNQQSLKPSSQLWSFDFNEDEWQIVKPNGEQAPPSLDSHAAVVDEINHAMYIFGGFSDSQKDGGYQNKVWKFSFESNQWDLLGENSETKPCKRAGSSITLYDNILYIFGGTIVDVKYNDMWSFDLQKNQWEHIKQEKEDIVPETRNGHSLLTYKDKLILFGGIHDITHEKNDMFVFNVRNKKWSIIDENTSHNQSSLNDDILAVEQSFSNGFQNEQSFKDQNKKSYPEVNKQSHNVRTKTKNSSLERIKAANSEKHNLSNSSRLLKQSMKKQNDSVGSKEESHTVNNQMEENRKKRIQMKKMNLLSEFELNEQEKSVIRPVSPTTENMKNSIQTVGNPLGKTKYSLRILDSSLTRTQLAGNSEQRQNKMIGRRPCARDGHSAVICDNFCFIFGGDRHMMSYNDLFCVDLDKLMESLP